MKKVARVFENVVRYHSAKSFIGVPSASQMTEQTRGGAKKRPNVEEADKAGDKYWRLTD